MTENEFRNISKIRELDSITDAHGIWVIYNYLDGRQSDVFIKNKWVALYSLNDGILHAVKEDGSVVDLVEKDTTNYCGAW